MTEQQQREDLFIATVAACEAFGHDVMAEIAPCLAVDMMSLATEVARDAAREILDGAPPVDVLRAAAHTVMLVKASSDLRTDDVLVDAFLTASIPPMNEGGYEYGYHEEIFTCWVDVLSTLAAPTLRRKGLPQ